MLIILFVESPGQCRGFVHYHANHGVTAGCRRKYLHGCRYSLVRAAKYRHPIKRNNLKVAMNKEPRCVSGDELI